MKLKYFHINILKLKNNKNQKIEMKNILKFKLKMKYNTKLFN